MSVGIRRSTRACCLRTPCRADYGRPALVERTLRRREASLLRRASVVRRFSCGLQRQPSARTTTSDCFFHLNAAKPTSRVFCQFYAFRPRLRSGRQLHALGANYMLWRPTRRPDRQLYAIEAKSRMLWPPTPRVSSQLHQATSRPGFHGTWWYRSRTTRVLRTPPPARGKRQGGDDGRTKTTPQHRWRNERGRGPSLRARALRGLHARRVCRTAIRASRASLVASSAAPARGGVASLRRADRGERREGRYDERRKKGDSPASPDLARLRRREPPDHTTLTRPRPRLAGVAYRDARSRGLAPRAAVSKEKTRRHDKAADRRQVRPTITTDRRVTKTRTVM